MASPDPASLHPDAAVSALVEQLRAAADPANAAGMARFGIGSEGTLGVSMTTLRALARPVLRIRKKDGSWRHEVAAGLWASGLHEPRILAILIEDATLVTQEQALEWAAGSDSWDITDQLCLSLLDRTPFAYELAEEWSHDEREFVKRAAFALIACLAWHDKSAEDARFLPFLAVIEREARDPRNFVKKSVNWALRTIGKRSAALWAPALATARALAATEDRTARWIGNDARRELEAKGPRTASSAGRV